MISEKYGKEAYKIAMDLESTVASVETELFAVRLQMQTIQSILNELDLDNIENITQELSNLSANLQTLAEQQTAFSSNLSALQSQTQAISSQILSLEQNSVPATRKINNKTLQQDIELTFSDVGLEAMVQSDVDFVYDN